MKIKLLIFVILFIIIFAFTLQVLFIIKHNPDFNIISPLAQIPPLLKKGEEAGQILYVSNRTGNYNIYLMDLTNLSIKNLSESSANDMNPQVSPDGQKFVYYSDRDKNSDIYQMDLYSKEIIQLTKDSGSNYDPSYSPDGKQIVFKSTRKDGLGDIYIMNADGSQQRNLTPARTDTEEWDPTFSKTGDKIIFVVRRDKNHNTDDLYIMKTDGSGLTQITGNTFPDWYPSINPKDGRITFTSKIKPNSPDILYICNEDGSDRKILTSLPGNDADPSWSTDGNKIIFINENNKNYDLFLINEDGKGLKKILETPSDELSPVFLSKIILDKL